MEGELAIIVGKELLDVTPEAAQAGFFGYACFNDLTARKFQMASDRWTLGKNTDSSGPLGPWIVTADEIPNPDQLRIQTYVNGSGVQDGNTSNLIFSGAKLAAYASGAARRPHRYRHSGWHRGDPETTHVPASRRYCRGRDRADRPHNQQDRPTLTLLDKGSLGRKRLSLSMLLVML